MKPVHLIIGVPILGAIIWIFLLIPLWGWVFVIIPVIGMFWLLLRGVRMTGERLLARRRQTALDKAVQSLSFSEREEYVNKQGFYSNHDLLPSNYPPQLMTPEERHIWANADWERR